MGIIYNILNQKIFIFFIIIIIYYFSNNIFCFIYNASHYRSIQLKNGNYLLVTNTGVYIYDSTLRTKISHIEIKQRPTFYLDYQLKHIGSEDNGYILLCCIDYFYIFSENGELLLEYEVPFDTKTNDFYSLITYDYDINNNYFYYVYHPSSKSYNYFIKFNYNSTLNNITLIEEIKILSFIEAYDNVSCHMIDYKNKTKIICLMLSEFLGRNTFYFVILDPNNNFEELDKTQIKSDHSNFIDSKTALMSKNGEQKILAILYYSSEIYWYGYNINKKKYEGKN